MKKNILITGGLGYIGSHGVVEFEKYGFKTVIVDNLSNSNIETLYGIEKILGYKPDFFKVDLRDKELLKTIFQKYNFDGVIHFAGLKAVGESCENPLEYHDNNIVGSIKLFELMNEFGVKNLIFSSSATVYKNIENKRGLLENDIVGDCENPYGTTKFIIEQILKDLSKFLSFNIINLRYFNPIGAHISGFIGEKPNGIPNNLVPYILKVASKELPYLKVFGNDYNTIDGTGVRDYIDVTDLILGHIKSYDKINSLDKFGFFETYNLGTGKGTSVIQMIKIIEEITSSKIKYEFCERRKGDLAEVYCNSEKAKKDLSWLSETTLYESLSRGWNFYNNQKIGKK